MIGGQFDLDGDVLWWDEVVGVVAHREIVEYAQLDVVDEGFEVGVGEGGSRGGVVILVRNDELDRGVRDLLGELPDVDVCAFGERMSRESAPNGREGED